MRKHSCPGGVKVARFLVMSGVSGSIPMSGLCFLLIFVVFTLCLVCYSSLLSACIIKRGAPFTASCLTPNLTLTERAPPALHLRSFNMRSLVCIYSRIMHEKI